jgi:hypothetical protein
MESGLANPVRPEPEDTEVRVAGSVVEEMRRMSRPEAAAAARAIQAIGPDAGTPVRIPSPGNPDGHYLALVPDDPAAPIVIYRPVTVDADSGYVVIALASRDTYAAYEQAERAGVLDTPLGKAVLSAASALVARGTVVPGGEPAPSTA